MSDRIKLLSDAVANQIAAGEVIQRPASAVKELLENAVDSGASRIDLIIKDAGKTLIQVADNGCGMSETDARMCFERHATSKIQDSKDLFNIRTLGFRGEALASIAAVAQVDMKTRLAEEELATHIRIEGSQVISQEVCPAEAGTNIQVKNLFFNIPARRNFLKSDAAESRHITEEFNRVALIHPTVEFRFYINGKPMVHLPSSNFKQRIVSVFGNNYQEKLIPVKTTTDRLNIDGYIGKPEFAKKSRGEQYFFVNKRFIKHPYLHHALSNAFSELIPKDAFPSYFICLETRTEDIDINIHPTKTEVNFIDAQYVYAVLHAAVKQSIGTHHLSPMIDFDVEASVVQSFGQKPGSIPKPPQIQINPEYNPFQPNYTGGNKTSQKGIKSSWESLYPSSGHSETGKKEQPDFFSTQAPVASEFMQFGKNHILTPVKSGLMILSIPEAHERILYEKYLHALKNHQKMSQQDLFPQTIYLSPEHSALLAEIQQQIAELGFDIEKFGTNSFMVKGTPAGQEGLDVQEAIEGILQNFLDLKSDLDSDNTIKLARSMAAQLRKNTSKRLQKEEMQQLFDQLFACKVPTESPAGLRTFRIITVNQIAHLFKE